MGKAKMDKAQDQLVHTRFTELFGVRLPIVAGGLMWLANAEYVAAAAHSGILGFITAASFSNLDELRDEIQKCRDLSQGMPFGVNVSMLPHRVTGEQTEEVFELIAQEGIPYIETSGRSPEPYMPLIKEAGIKILHKVATVRHAVSAQRQGVDAVSIVGAECGGHPGVEMVGTMVNTAWAARCLEIPYLVGGGFGCGSQITAALGMGASGVVIGTKFLTAHEIWAHDDYKKRLIEAQPTDTALCMHTVRNTVRVLRNDTVNEVQEIERTKEDVTIEDLLPLVRGSFAREAYTSGDVRRGLLSAGQSLAFVEQQQPLAEIVQELEDGMRLAFDRLDQLRQPVSQKAQASS
ncbi:MAG TPA: nitronate monooxygenase [Paenalcaligenes sp.]|nr:nitronate monooxygenase [Paenalcaligenes sp.]